MMKTRQDNNMIDCIGLVYVETETKLSRPKCGLWWKPDKTMMWLIIEVCSTLKMILNCHDQSDQVQSMIKTR